MPSNRHSAHKRKLPNRTAQLTGGLVIAFFLLVGTEAALRIVGFDYQPRIKRLYLPKISGFDGTYQFYLDTSFAPPGYIWKTEPNTKYTDRNGFRLPEVPFNKTPDKTRIAFLGGSTTQGGHRPYPERAIQLLNESVATNRFEVLNVACSSYSTHQSLIAFDRWVLPRSPDIVVIYHGWNDIHVPGDGYSDKEKDYLVSASGDPRVKIPALVDNLKLTGLLRRGLAYFDRSWPRQRVSFQDIEKHYEALAQKCEDNDIKLFVVIRPSKTNLANAQLSAEEISSYRSNASRITGIQRLVASHHKHVEIIDAESVINDLQTTQHGAVFLNDACHLYEYAEEVLAQHVAMAIAPNLHDAISNRLHSADYTFRLATELIADISPREAAMLIREQMRRSGKDRSSRIEALLEQAESDYIFADLFRGGRMGGSIVNPDEKIAALKRCQLIKPYDIGVKQQIDFVTQSGDRAHVP